MTKARLYCILLELGREPGHPQGDPGHSYRLYLPLDDDGRIDPTGYRDMPHWCRVTRHRPGEEPSHGRILHGPGGRWIFDYSDAGTRDDEVGFKWSAEIFRPGEYVSIREDDGRTHPFRIISVEPD